MIHATLLWTAFKLVNGKAPTEIILTRHPVGFAIAETEGEKAHSIKVGQHSALVHAWCRQHIT